MSWSYDLVVSMLGALEECGLTSECTHIWPGCTPPLDYEYGGCQKRMWVTFAEGNGNSEIVECDGPFRQAVSVTLWVKQCDPEFDPAGLLPDNLAQIAEASAQYRTDVIDFLQQWIARSCEGNCIGGCWGGIIGQWTCDDKKDGACAVRTLRIDFVRSG